MIQSVLTPVRLPGSATQHLIHVTDVEDISFTERMSSRAIEVLNVQPVCKARLRMIAG